MNRFMKISQIYAHIIGLLRYIHTKISYKRYRIIENKKSKILTNLINEIITYIRVEGFSNIK
jgi:hypothetical protein